MGMKDKANVLYAEKNYQAALGMDVYILIPERLNNVLSKLNTNHSNMGLRYQDMYMDVSNIYAYFISRLLLLILSGASGVVFL